MDSLTQLTCGAALGELILGRRVGRKALVWGGILGTLPDLDVLIPRGGPVEDFVFHRGWSHSVLVLALVAPLVGWLLSRLHASTREHQRGWMLTTFVVLQTSVVLDYLTVYGTRILWPVDPDPHAWPAFFIVDPLFTLPLLVGSLAALLTRRTWGPRLNRIGVIGASLYLVWALAAREFVEDRVRDELDRRGVSYSQLVGTPTPFNTLLWRFVGVEGDRYFETYRSLFDGEAPLVITHHERNNALLAGLEDHPPVENLRWFTRGMYAVDCEADAIVVTDLRMGSEDAYVFRFVVARVDETGPTAVPAEHLAPDFTWEQLLWIWRRIRGPVPTGDP